MRGRNISEVRSSSRGRGYVRNTADITPRWNNIRTDSDIKELGKMLGRLDINITKLSNNPKNFDFTNAIKRRL